MSLGYIDIYDILFVKTPKQLAARCLALDALNDYTWQKHLVEKCIVYKTNNKYYEILTIYNASKNNRMTLCCNI